MMNDVTSMLRRFAVPESVKKIARDTAIVFLFFVGVGIASAGTIKIAANMPPVAVQDTYYTPQDTTLNVAAPGILENDTDPEGVALSVWLITGVNAGTLTVNANGSFGYVPNTGFFGNDFFEYRVTDGTNDSNIVRVNLSVTKFNHQPATGADSYAIGANTQLIVEAPGILTNDADVDGQKLTAQMEIGPKYGSASLSPNGKLLYVPNENFNGLDIIKYRANDGIDDSNSTAIAIQVGQKNDEPTAVNDTVSTMKNTPQIIDVLANDSDPENNKRIFSTPSRSTKDGYVSIDGDKVRYTPANNFIGEDTFTYVLTDGSYRNTATVTVNVIDASSTTPSPVPTPVATAPTPLPSQPLTPLSPLTQLSPLSPGDLIKLATSTSVYWYGADGKRHVFPNEATYRTWYANFTNINIVSAEQMASIPLGKNVTYRPGIRMVKVPSDPTVYAVDRFDVLRAVKDEETAYRMYGSAWWRMIDDMSEAFFNNYTIGEPITAASQFNPQGVASTTSTILENEKTP